MIVKDQGASYFTDLLEFDNVSIFCADQFTFIALTASILHLLLFLTMHSGLSSRLSYVLSYVSKKDKLLKLNECILMRSEALHVFDDLLTIANCIRFFNQLLRFKK